VFIATADRLSGAARPKTAKSTDKSRNCKHPARNLIFNPWEDGPGFQGGFLQTWKKWQQGSSV
jgi:hypothetical protein